jgi:hypothetical protein
MKALSLSLRPLFFLASSSSCFLLSFAFSKKSLTSFHTDPSVSSSVFASSFSLLIVFVFSLVVAPTWKIALESLWRMVVEVNWEGCHHRDRRSSVHPNCRMVVAEKVNEQVVLMMAWRRWLP